MSETKFTKGPWKWQDEEEYGIVVHAEHSPIAMVICEEDKANATLIAAAPDMYEALETIERVAGIGMMEDDPARVKARDALRKARGETE